jgi:hypothetical protein
MDGDRVVEFEIGARYVVQIPDEGQVEATLVGREPPQIIREGGGEEAIPQCRVEYEGQEYVIVEPAIIRRADD